MDPKLREQIAKRKKKYISDNNLPSTTSTTTLSTPM